MKKDESTLYEIIGAREDADQFELRDSAQVLANRINEAYRLLQDPEQRAAYDAQLREQRQRRKRNLKRISGLKIIFFDALIPILIAVAIVIAYRLTAWGIMEYDSATRLPNWFFLKQDLISVGIIGIGILWAIISALLTFKRTLLA